MQYSGITLTNKTGTINKNKYLKLNQVLKGEYDFSYKFTSLDTKDKLKLVVGEGSLLLSTNGGTSWLTVNNFFELNYRSTTTKLKIQVLSRSAKFAFVSADKENLSSPQIQLTLGQQFNFDMPNSRYSSWAMGEVDPLTGLSYNQGKLTSLDTPGITILETIGGDDVADYAKFSLKNPESIHIDTQNAIVQVINYKGQVVLDSNDSYTSALDGNLAAGTYYLGFSSESSTIGTFTSEISFI